ncbi:response regulator [Pseudoduganella sp. FT55W]|uniref:Virulence sensor protein BvgS n=1 Tax=Duganella rivi TaxID=2666083 RepID=A0A7X4GR32_9BURK|nr:response regulator [Duganella rivi]
MPEEKRKQLPSIRSQIALLVLACALPTVIGFGALVAQFYSNERETLKTDTQQAARAVAAAIDRDLVQSEGAIIALASSPSLRSGDFNALRLQAGALLSPQFPASQFIVSDAGGKAVLNVGAPLPDTLNQANNARRLTALFGHGRPQMSVVVVEGSALLTIDVPVFLESRVAYAITALLKPDRLARILKDEHITADQAMTLFDPDGNIIAQAGGPRLLLGHAADPALREQLNKKHEVLLQTDDAAGTPVYMGLSRAPVNGAVVAISTPQSRATEQLLQAVAPISLTMLAVLAAGFSLAWSVGGRIARSVRELVGPAQALASGKPFAMPETTFAEADMLAHALHALEGDLHRHSQELESLVAERTSQLEKNRSQLETLYATAPVGLSYVDAELRVLRINDYLAALNQQKVVAHLGRHIGDMIPDDAVRNAVLEDYRIVLESGKPLTGIERAGHPASSPEELRHWVVSYYPQFGVDGKITGITGLLLDVTEHKRVEAELRATAERLTASEHFVRAVTDNLPGKVAYWDAALRCRFGNRFFLDWHGVSQEQIIGAYMPDVVGQQQCDERGPYIQAALAGEAQGFAGKLQWPSGETSHIWVNYIPDVDDTGAVKGFFMLVSDVTELKEAELHLQEVNEELILARDRAEAASRAKSEFLANMSHEIRTPMNAIIGLARLLEEAPLAPRERGYLHKIQFATQSLLSLVNDVLDFSRVEAGQLVLEHANFHLQHILDSISVMLSGSAAEKGVELVYDIDPAIPTELAGDPMRLQQVLLNLVSNAIKFTEHGEVVLSARPAPGSVKPGDRAMLVEFRVRDTGIGIAPEQQAGIFDAFSQADSSTSRKFGGAGLGLAICRQLADMMGGAISVSSELGRGAEFLFACPLECTAPLAAPTPAPAVKSLSVLIVDDNPSVRNALHAAGQSFGWHTACAAGAQQALSLLQERARAGRPYDLLMLDRDMPGIDGPTMLQQLPDGLALPPVLMLTSEHSAATLVQQSAALGLAGVLAKPVSPARLLERVSALLAGDQATSGILSQLEHTPLQGRLNGMRILLVEDNEINQEVAQYMLLHAGATVEVAANGQLAVELLAAAAERYDVVLMDVQMPIMNGYDATREIRRLGLLTLPIIAMTANVLEDDRRRAAEAGMNAHVAKPIDVEELISVLTRLVTIRDASRDMVAPVPAKAPPAVPPATLMPPLSPLPGIDVEAALARLGGNHDALTSLLKRFEQSQGGAVAEVRTLLAAGQRQQAAQVLHRLRGVAANLGATDVARLTAAAETVLHENTADTLAMPTALSRLEQALELVTRTARGLVAPAQDAPTSHTATPDLEQKLAQLQGLLQNNNLKALEHYRALRPALASAGQAQALGEAVETLNFKAAYQMVEEMLQRKESA